MTKRKILTTFIIPCLLISGLIIFLINNKRELYGELVLDPTQLNFGTIPEWNGAVTRIITARNVGQTDIHITSIQAGCSYAEIEAPKIIAPNTEAPINVSINPQTLPDNSSTATTILFTDSPKTPQLYLTLNAKAQRFATLSANICDFGNVQFGTIHKKRIKLKVYAPINQDEIRLLPSPLPNLTWEISYTPDSQYGLITIGLKVPHKEKVSDNAVYTTNAYKIFSAQLTIAFPNQRTLTLPIVARFVEPITIKPEILSYGNINGRTPPPLEFNLIAKIKFKVLDIQTPDYIEIIDISKTKKSDAPDTQFQKWFKVIWNVSKSPILLQEHIHITTNVSPTPIRIPIYGYNSTHQSITPSSIHNE